MRGIKTNDAIKLIQRTYPQAGNLRIVEAQHSNGTHWYKLDGENGWPIRELGRLFDMKYHAVGIRLIDQYGQVKRPDYQLDEFVKEFRFEPLDVLDVDVNQGQREAVVVAVDGEEALIEYEMPAGTTALWVIDRHDPRAFKLRGVSYKTLPTRWKRAIEEAGTQLIANPQ